ncbi:MAG: phosphotransferase family protein [Micromonosporaceae bacterium]
MNTTATTPLDTESAVPYLRDRGLIDPDQPARSRALPGGVSAVTLLVEAAGRRLVVKQARSRLTVAREWRADPARIATEAAAMSTYGAITPEAAPEVVDIDPMRHVLTMTAAPAAARPWKEDLLAGRTDAAVAETLGEVLGRWHHATRHHPEVAHQFRDDRTFMQLRGEPYHRAVATALPNLATPVLECLDELLGQRECLVHGDFSPKNVLVGITTPWVLDFEVARYGAPVFDLAFMLSHLLLKATHLPRCAPRLRAAAAGFLTRYEHTSGSVPADSRIAAHTGCLLLSRVVGKSPAEYLTSAEQRRVVDLGAALLTGAVHTMDLVWSAC